MKYNNVQILYDKKGNVTKKLGKNVLKVLILPNVQILEAYSKHTTKKIGKENICRIEKGKLKSLRQLVAVKLKQIKEKCFKESMIEQFVGDKLEIIGIESFRYSFFLKQINLKNVKEIGKSAFLQTSLRMIKNNQIQKLNNTQFFDLISDVEKVNMRSLNDLSITAFYNCTINEFNAPNLDTSSFDEIIFEEQHEEYITFFVGKKNFQDSAGILKKVDFPNIEPNYEQLILKLPKECFECENVSKVNYKLFIIDNVVVFPNNVISVEDDAFSNISNLDQVHYIYGKNVEIIGQQAFHSIKSLRNAMFPNLLEIKKYAFFSCLKLSQFLAPMCEILGEGAFCECYSLSQLQMQPKVLKKDVFKQTSIQYLNLPSVTHIENGAFGGSKLRSLIVEKCECIESEAFVDQLNIMENQVQVQCGNLNLNNVKNCKKVEKVVSDEQKSLQLAKIVDFCNKQKESRKYIKLKLKIIKQTK